MGRRRQIIACQVARGRGPVYRCVFVRGGKLLLRCPINSLIGAAIVVAGIPVYFIWGTHSARIETRHERTSQNDRVALHGVGQTCAHARVHLATSQRGKYPNDCLSRTYRKISEITGPAGYGYDELRKRLAAKTGAPVE